MKPPPQLRPTDNEAMRPCEERDAKYRLDAAITGSLKPVEPSGRTVRLATREVHQGPLQTLNIDVLLSMRLAWRLKTMQVIHQQRRRLKLCLMVLPLRNKQILCPPLLEK